MGSCTSNQNKVYPPKQGQNNKGQLIDSGAYGKVYQGLNLNNGQLLAIKTVKLANNREKARKEVQALKQEISLLKKLQHKNIVRYLHTEICEEQDGVDIVLEYVPGGSIRTLLNKFGKFEEKVVSIYTQQILQGLQYLHSNNVIHRDIKGANILIDTDGTIKLTDFGTSKKIVTLNEDENPQDGRENDLIYQNKSFKGSPYWMAPEVVKRIGHSSSADIWSVGGVVIEMLTGQPPYNNQVKNIKEVFQLIANDIKPNYPNYISKQCTEFLDSTLNPNPLQRLTAAQLMELPFIKSPDNIDNQPEQQQQQISNTQYNQNNINNINWVTVNSQSSEKHNINNQSNIKEKDNAIHQIKYQPIHKFDEKDEDLHQDENNDFIFQKQKSIMKGQFFINDKKIENNNQIQQQQYYKQDTQQQDQIQKKQMENSLIKNPDKIIINTKQAQKEREELQNFQQLQNQYDEQRIKKQKEWEEALKNELFKIKQQQSKVNLENNNQ